MTKAHKNAETGNPTETGADGILKVGGQEYAISNVSYDDEIETSEVQHNDSLKADIAVTGIRYSGSFEHQGSNESLRNAIRWDKSGEKTDSEGNSLGYKEKGEPKRVTITVKEETEDGTKTRTFKDALVTTRSRDIPADDVTSTSYDFTAPKMLPLNG